MTGAALAATAYTRVLGKQIDLASSEDPTHTEKSARNPLDTGQVERHPSHAHWAVPALTCGLIVLDALDGEQRRPTRQMHGVWQRARSPAPQPSPGGHWRPTH
ncbi:hypothetical protein [Streptomyces subrutilus]|uniref:hypothetical protein n=1 Tax=Streptomyces subrutilus TaxID=36818 RepID=UPI002E0D93E4|nr:hypothetical protein OG479_34130 [Streptomyces subrutilus]